jgi:uroporphyrinogen III methyltransferase/synthase
LSPVAKPAKPSTARSTAHATATVPASFARAGRVSFVGAGPGDPELLTLRASELLREADLVIADHGLAAAFVGRCRDGAEIVELTAAVPDTVAAGSGGSSAVDVLGPASRIKAMTGAAKNGRTVVRLYRGDAGLAGALASEAGACVKAGLPFEVVPGVATATAIPAYAGVAIGAGDNNGRAVRIVAADSADADGSGWRRVVAGAVAGHHDETLVLIGRGEQFAAAVAELTAAGLPADTPVAATVDGSLTSQRTVTASLDRVEAAAAAAGVSFTGEWVAVVGAAVAHRDTLSWYETKPLFGWKVLVPRTKEQAAALSTQLRGYGAVPHEVPTIAVEPPRTPQQMERAIKGLVTGRYEWVAFTSANAVKAVREKFEEYGLDARAFAGIKIAAVGEQTAAALRAFGVNPDLVPSGEQSAAGLLEDFPPYDAVFDPIDRVFLPRADIATETLVAGLVELGWEVDDVTAYRTVRAAPPPAEVREAIKGGGFDAVLFTSSSTVRNLVGIAGKPHATTVIACIGPATAKTAEEHGLRVDVLSPEPSVSALAEALADFGAARRLAAVTAGTPVYRPSERRSARARRAR